MCEGHDSEGHDSEGHGEGRDSEGHGEGHGEVVRRYLSVVLSV